MPANREGRSQARSRPRGRACAAGRRRAATLVAVSVGLLAIAPGLAACGKRGRPAPPEEKSDYPRTYPDPKSY